MDEDLEKLKREIEALSFALSELSDTAGTAAEKMGKVFGAETVKASKRFQNLNRELDKATDAQKNLTQQQKQELQAKKKLSELSEKEWYERRRQLSDALRNRNRTQELFDQFERTGGMTQMLRDRFEGLGKESIAMTGFLKFVTAGIEGLGKAAFSMGKALWQGQRGAKVSADALGELANSLSGIMGTLGAIATALSFTPWGRTIKGLKLLGGALMGAAGLTQLSAEATKALAEQNDKLFQSFNELGKVGMSAATGMDATFDTLQQLGMTVGEIQEFNRLMTASAKTLALFGATAAQGGEEFAKVAGGLYKSQLGQQLENMGITAEAQREAALTYMSIQARTGQLELANTQKLIKESAKFATELDLMARLTGQSREETAKQMEANLADARYRAAMDQAVAAGDEEQIKRLKVAGQLASLFEAQGLTSLAVGTRALAAGRGAVTGPQAVEAMNAGVREAIASGDFGQAMSVLSKTMPQFNRQMRGIVPFTGNLEGYMADYSKSQDMTVKLQAMTNEIQTKFGGDVDAYLKSIKERDKGADQTTRDNVSAARTQQAAAQLQDRAAYTYNYAATLNKTASETFRDAVNVFSRTVGAKPVPGGVPGGGAGVAPGPAPSGKTTPGAAELRGAAAKNLNPGNLRFAGQAGATMGTDGFARFQTVDEGLVALANQINLYLTGKSSMGRLDTVSTLIGAYAPPNENDTKAYVEKVAAFMGMDANANIGRDPATMAKLMTAIIGVENFGDPNRGYNFRSGVQMAVAQVLGVDPSQIGKFRTGGIASGPRSGYAALLHGTEAVVPLPDGRYIPVKLDNRETTESLNRQLTTLQMQLTKMDEMIGVMRENNSISSKILQVSRN